MTSPVDLCNMALDQIVARTSITGINPASPPNNLAAQVASRTYQTQADAVFRSAHWNSARLQAGLTLLKAAVGTPENPDGALPSPPLPWRYEYAYPNDCLKVRFVIPTPNLPIPGQAPLMTNVGVSLQPLVNTALPFVPAIDKDANGNQIKVILTNACRAQVVYTARIDNPDLWDSSLQNAVIGALAAWFALPVTGDKELMKLRVQMASALINTARVSDGNEGITSTDHIPDWMMIRDTGSNFIGFGGHNGGLVAGWDAWAGPDGISY
jgi:hypothetical protein